MSRRGRLAFPVRANVALILTIVLAACGRGAVADQSPRGPATAERSSIDREPANTARGDLRGAPLYRLQAGRIGTSGRAALVAAFVGAVGSLPPVASRLLHLDPRTGQVYRPEEIAGLDRTVREHLQQKVVSEHEYYAHETPLTYVNTLRVLAELGVDSLEGLTILDFGYGAIGHLRVMAMMGANVHGIEVSPLRAALYGPDDQGDVGGTRGGRITLHHGRFPSDRGLAAEVGDGYDVIMVQNVLKRSLLRADKPVVDLGVSHPEFASAVLARVRPGGRVIVSCAPRSGDMHERDSAHIGRTK